MAKANKWGQLALILAAVFFWQSCLSTMSSVRQAREYFKSGDFDKASAILEKAAVENPKSDEIRTMLFRAKLNSYYYHLALARQKKKLNDRPAAEHEYGTALAIFPGNVQLQDEFNDYNNPRRIVKEETFKSTIIAPVQLNIKKDEKVSLSLKNTPITNIFKSLGRTYNINFIFDKDFRDFLHSLEIENTTFFEVLKVLCMVSGSQYRVLDPHTAIIYPDVFAKKKVFDLRGIKTFYMSNIKAEDARKMIQIVFRDEQILIQEDTNLNAVVIRADFNTLAEIERFLLRIDKEKNEVEINVEILEINRSIISKLGADYGNGSFKLSAGVADASGDISNTMNVSDLGSTNFFLTIPSVALNFLESDANNKIIAKPNLRGIDGEEISFMVGDEVPVPETQFQAIAAGGINSSPVTTYRYRNVGVEIKITPFIHQNNEVTLKTKLTINFISSGASSAFPTFGKREIENKIRLKEGETNIIGGLIRDDIRGSLNGFPLLDKIPLLGKLFGSSEKTVSQTDLIFSITPKIVRKTPISVSDVETIWGGGAEAASGGESASSGGMVMPPEMADPGQQLPASSGNSQVTISADQSNIPVNSESYFSIRMQSDISLASLAMSGAVNGGPCEITEIRTDSLSESEVKVLKNSTVNSFDIGLSFNRNSGQVLAAAVIQLKVKFTRPGKYVVSIDNINAYDLKRGRVEIARASCPVEVF